MSPTPNSSTRSILAAIFLLLAAALPCSAQSDPYVNNSNLRGVVPFGSYQFGDIDNINLGTGTVNLKIPLFSRQGRGVDLNYFVFYTSKIWVQQAYYDPTGVLSFFAWQVTMSPTGPLITTNLGGNIDYNEQAYVCEVSPGGPSVYQHNYSNFLFHTFDGAIYRFPNAITTVTPQYGIYCTNPVLNTDAGVSDTGVMELDNATFTVKFKNGSQETGIRIVDANGNFIDSTGDTLGRTYPFQYPSGPLTVYDSNGNPQNYTWGGSGGTPAQTQFPTTSCQGVRIGQAPTGGGGTSTLTLPDGHSFTFSFDPVFEEVTKVTLPTGGYIRYQYQTIALFDNPNVNVWPSCRLDSRRVSDRYVSPDGTSQHEQHWNYSYAYTPSPPVYTTTVTDPSGNVSVHTFPFLDGNGFSDGIHETKTQIYQGSSTLLRTIVNTWAADGLPVATDQQNSVYYDSGNHRIIDTQTTLADTGQVNDVQTDYDSYILGNRTYSAVNVKAVREYDFGNGSHGPLLNRTAYTYLHESNTNYVTHHILDRVTSKTIYDSTNNTCAGLSQPCAQTTSSYDGTTISAQSGVFHHDYTDYPASMVYRGNLTQVQRWRNTDGAWLTTAHW